MEHLLHSLLRLHAAVTGVRHRPRDDRGDVPGWVMVTVMTAGLVAVLTAVAGPALQQMLTSALNSVK
ncbi:hypothetical protein [Nocardioides pantholopis]|uniref:hypothetical protein n=1 Tax=Nocardioides pantholopis TaxID=2483798 RepID=UPI000FDCD036|nr:hypothetical protein [Nocardioides pantholopis]